MKDAIRTIIIVALSAAATSLLYWSYRDYQTCVQGEGPYTRGVLWSCERAEGGQ